MWFWLLSEYSDYLYCIFIFLSMLYISVNVPIRSVHTFWGLSLFSTTHSWWESSFWAIWQVPPAPPTCHSTSPTGTRWPTSHDCVSVSVYKHFKLHSWLLSSHYYATTISVFALHGIADLCCQHLKSMAHQHQSFLASALHILQQFLSMDEAHSLEGSTIDRCNSTDLGLFPNMVSYKSLPQSNDTGRVWNRVNFESTPPNLGKTPVSSLPQPILRSWHCWSIPSLLILVGYDFPHCYTHTHSTTLHLH